MRWDTGRLPRAGRQAPGTAWGGVTGSVGGLLGCGCGSGAGGHDVVDRPDAAGVGLVSAGGGHAGEAAALLRPPVRPGGGGCHLLRAARRADREIGKSTRLNSSHPSISYAVFCLKKKKKK